FCCRPLRLREAMVHRLVAAQVCLAALLGLGSRTYAGSVYPEPAAGRAWLDTWRRAAYGPRLWKLLNPWAPSGSEWRNGVWPESLKPLAADSTDMRLDSSGDQSHRGVLPDLRTLARLLAKVMEACANAPSSGAGFPSADREQDKFRPELALYLAADRELSIPSPFLEGLFRPPRTWDHDCAFCLSSWFYLDKKG